MNNTIDSTDSWLAREIEPPLITVPSLAERRLVWVGLILFLLFNIATASRYPFVWIDEVMYTDPAANFHLGNGFVSGAWYAQQSQEFWAGNVPLHPMILTVWMKLFGFSATAIRSINFVYMIGAMWLLWQSCLRWQLIKTMRLRLALLALVAGGYSMIFSYRSGRPDCLVLLLVCAAVYTATRNCWRQRIFGLMALGAAMPWAGLQVLPLLVIGGLLLLIYVGWRILPALLSLYAGVGVGGLTLVWFFQAHGVFPQFLKSVRQHTQLGFLGWLARGHVRHSNLVPKDFSFMLLFLFALILAALWLRKNNLRSALSFGLAYSICVTFGLIASGKFPTYYGWMTYVPLAVCVCHTVSILPATRLLRALTFLFFSAALFLSVGLHTITAASDWSDRDYRHVRSLVNASVTSNDWMYAEYATFYAARPLTPHLFMPIYIKAFSAEEKARLSVLIIPPQNLTDVTNEIGGDWVATGAKNIPASMGFWATRRNMGFLSLSNYDLTVYRRK